MDAQGSETRPVSRIRRWGSLSPLVAATAVSALMVLAPAAFSAAPNAVYLKAPYKTAIWQPYWSVYTGGCGSAKMTNRPIWSGSAGVGTFGFTAQSKGCAKRIGNIHPSSQGSVGVQFDMALPVHFSRSGAHLITANWTLSIATNQSISAAGICVPPKGSQNIYCSAGTYIDDYGYGYLRDLTNGSTVPSMTYWGGIYNSTYMQSTAYCYLGTCGYGYSLGRSWNGGNLNGNTTFQWVMNASGTSSINASHQYVLEVYFSGSGNTGEYNYASGYVTASQNMATNGHGWKLNFIKIV